MNTDFWKGKRVFLTGHSGFKGGWTVLCLQRLGAIVKGYSLEPNTTPSLFEIANIRDGIESEFGDVRDLDKLKKSLLDFSPEIVIHMAAQPLVRLSYQNPVETYQTNVMGTVNLFEAVRACESVIAVVNVTTDKCYENNEWVWGYRETDAMGGPDPYSASKGAAELAIRSHIKSYFPKENSKVRIASARAGNVIGGGDWAVDRIIPDCVKAWSSKGLVELRNPHSTRPWQHVLEPLSGYLNQAIALSDKPELHGEPLNFGPQAQQNHSVLELVKQMALHWDQVKWRDISESTEGPYESGLLKLNCDKALHHLNWHAVMGFEDTVRMTAQWYRSYYESPKVILATTNQQIDDYTAIAKEQGLDWAQ